MNDYKKYNAVELAEDQSFIQWVFNPNDLKSQFWENWVQEHPDKQPLVKEARTLVLSFQFKHEDFKPEQIEGLWAKIDQATSSEKRPARKRMLNTWYPYGIAASLVLAVSLYFLLTPSAQTIQTAKGEWAAHILPDQSEVSINADSEINYSGTWEDNRQVELKGEAFFEVTKGVPFSVITPYGEVRVLGTSFNIFAREDKFRVNCFSGKVEVISKNGRDFILTKGQSIHFNRGQSKLLNNLTKAMPDWQNGEFYYDSIPLMEVFEELERQFNIEINSDYIATNRFYSGFFSRNNLDSAILNVTFPMNLEAERAGDVVILKDSK